MYVFLGLPRLLPLDGTQFVVCLANLCSSNLSTWPAKRTRRSVNGMTNFYRTTLFVMWSRYVMPRIFRNFRDNDISVRSTPDFGGRVSCPP